MRQLFVGIVVSLVACGLSWRRSRRPEIPGRPDYVPRNWWTGAEISPQWILGWLALWVSAGAVFVVWFAVDPSDYFHANVAAIPALVGTGLAIEHASRFGPRAWRAWRRRLPT